jgi:hypothetical protein
MQRNPARLYLTHFGQVSQLDELTEQLHQEIDAYVSIVEACDNASDVTEIASRLSSHLLSRLSALNPDTSQSHAETVLSHDIELNAQGLSFWKQQGNP